MTEQEQAIDESIYRNGVLYSTPEITVSKSEPPKFHSYPWRALAVSTELEDGSYEGPSFLMVGTKRLATARVSATRMGKSLGKKFLVNKTSEGMRVWRVK